MHIKTTYHETRLLHILIDLPGACRNVAEFGYERSVLTTSVADKEPQQLHLSGPEWNQQIRKCYGELGCMIRFQIRKHMEMTQSQFVERRDFGASGTGKELKFCFIRTAIGRILSTFSVWNPIDQ